MRQRRNLCVVHAAPSSARQFISIAKSNVRIFLKTRGLVTEDSTALRRSN